MHLADALKNTEAVAKVADVEDGKDEFNVGLWTDLSQLQIL